jgi:transcriptional regulator with XRE-family HTH domain
MVPKKDNLAAKLNRLFEEKRKSDGTQYTQTEVVQGCKGMLNRVYLWKLRTGRATNPGFHVLQALAAFFGVEPSYFFEGDEIRVETVKKKQKQDELINQIALRSSELDDAGKQAVLYMIESIVRSKK